MRRRLLLLTALLLQLSATTPAQERPVVVGSKNFAESTLLAEIMAQLLEARGRIVERRFGFGGTLVAYEALRAGEIDVYAEYTGTVEQVILAPDRLLDATALRQRVERLGLELLPELGFDNTYALALTPETAQRHGLSRISDLAAHSELRFGLSHEFRERADGWPGLKRAYGLPQGSSGIEHGLAYRALLGGEIDVTDAYSTDGDLLRYELVILDDDLGYFPSYRALPFVRADLDAPAKAVLAELGARVDNESMRRLNAEVVVAQRSFAAVAAEFLAAQGLVAARASVVEEALWQSLLANTLVHLKLTGIAVLTASLAGLGLAVSVHRSQSLSKGVLYATGLMQTIPSIALLALLIPIAGVGQLPAIIALFLYSLLPIARNTITALTTIDPVLRLVARALGLSQWQRLRTIYLPLALPHVLAGVRIAAVVSIGTATLAAFIGAGGLGEPIVTGLALNNTGLILQGALPAAGLAILVELAFEGLERVLVPRHLIATHTLS